MMTQAHLTLPSHLAGPYLTNLVAAGLMSLESARAALQESTARAAVSPCGRKARIARSQIEGSGPNAATRGRAAQAVRNSLQPMLAERAPWPLLRGAARREAARVLRSDEIDMLIRQQVAAHLLACRRRHA